MDAVAPAATKTEFVKQMYAYFVTGNIPALLAALPAVQEWRAMGAPQVAYGRDYRGDELLTFFQNLGGSLQVTEFNPHTYVEQGENVVAIGTMAGTSIKTGKPFSIRWAHQWKFAGDEVIGFYDHLDSLRIYAALINQDLPEPA
jgi:ketosteroid isomerase-like protein